MDFASARRRPDNGVLFVAAAKQRGIDLKIVDWPLQEARDLYRADLVLIRPDQIVAWRGNSDAAAAQVLERLLGKS